MSDNNGISGNVYLTRERLVELENELRELKIKGRADMAQRIGEARSYGDLSENAEYDAAKEAQQHLELRIAKLEFTLSRARILEKREIPTDKVYILSVVKVRDMKSKKEFEYRMVSAEEADFEQNKLSCTSPIGKALMGKTKGDIIQVKVPAGSLEYEIIDIGR
jgi:transcription elongation factor GreA